jgi:predicted transcriptional regulator
MQVTINMPDTLATRLRAAGLDPATTAQQVLSADEYQQLLDAAAEVDIHESLRQGREDIAAGNTYPAEEVFAEIRAKYGIPD